MVVRNGQVCECNLCGHIWLPRLKNTDGTHAVPKCCAGAKCKSPLWNSPTVVPRESSRDTPNIKPESVSEPLIVPKSENLDAKNSEVIKEEKSENTEQLNKTSKLFAHFSAIASPESLLTILSPMRTLSDEITFYASQADLSFANCDSAMTAMSIVKVPSTSFSQFNFSPAFYSIERQIDPILEFAIKRDELLGTLNRTATCHDVSIFSRGNDDFLHIQEGGKMFNLRKLKSKHVRPTAPEFAYVAKLVAPTNFIQELLADMDVLADRINIISTNNSQILFTGVSDGNSGLVVEKVIPPQIKEKGIDITFFTTRKFQSTFDMTMLKNIVDSVKTPILSLELSIDGPMRISSEFYGAIASVHLANAIVAKIDEK